MPLLKEQDERGGYRSFMKRTFKPFVDNRAKKGKLPEGVLAVVYDKNPMEASGYALAMAQVFNEDVYLIEFPDKGIDATYTYARWTENNRIMQIKVTEEGEWMNVRVSVF